MLTFLRDLGKLSFFFAGNKADIFDKFTVYTALSKMICRLTEIIPVGRKKVKISRPRNGKECALLRGLRTYVNYEECDALGEAQCEIVLRMRGEKEEYASEVHSKIRLSIG